MRRWLVLASLAALAPACAGAGLHEEVTMRYSTRAEAVVITQRRTTGTVGPQYLHEDTLLVHGDGAWRATRVYPFADPERRETLGAGALSPEGLRSLVAVAAQRPSFLELAASSDDGTLGSATRRIDLALETGTHSVTVTGRGPEAFERFDQAIASATLPLAP